MCNLASAIFDIELNMQFCLRNVCKTRVFIFEQMADHTVFQVMIFIGGRNLALSMLCNMIPPVGLLLFTSKSI